MRQNATFIQACITGIEVSLEKQSGRNEIEERKYQGGISCEQPVRKKRELVAIASYLPLSSLAGLEFRMQLDFGYVTYPGIMKLEKKSFGRLLRNINLPKREMEEKKREKIPLAVSYLHESSEIVAAIQQHEQTRRRMKVIILRCWSTKIKILDLQATDPFPELSVIGFVLRRSFYLLFKLFWLTIFCLWWKDL